MLGYLFGAILLTLIWMLVLALSLPWWVAGMPTGVALLGIGAILFVRQRQAKAAAQGLEDALSAQGAAQVANARPDQQPEIEEMQSEFAKAIASLKTSKLSKGGKDALSVLPWYLIIGPPGGGKSTALRNSGLQFPYANSRGGRVKGVGGTRNCEWWLTNEAVILDTAGRYTTEDDDREEWFEFLDTLVKNRPRRPINGLLVAVSAGDLLGTEEEAIALGTRVRERADEVMARLGMQVPVYVFLTKVDLLAGFVEMFGDLNKQDRGQVWGFTVSQSERESAPRELFQQRFDELLGQLEARSLTRLSQVRRAEDRGLIYQFPQQFAELRQNFSEFISTLFATDVYQEAPLMRGVYLSSATQEGNPIDRVMQRVASAFGIRSPLDRAPAATEPKSYFLRDLFGTVIFPDQKLAVRSGREQKRRTKLMYAYAGGGLAAALLFTFLPVVGFARNRARLVELRESAERFARDPAAANGGGGALLALEPVRAAVAPWVDEAEQGAPLLSRLGMYQGDAILPAAKAYYAKQLQQILVQPRVESDAKSLRKFASAQEGDGSNVNPREFGRAYDQLKLHLLLTGPRGAGSEDAPVMDPSLQHFVSRELETWGAHALETSPESRGALHAHSELYGRILSLPEPPLLPRDAGLVKRARAAVRRIPPATLAVERLASEVDQDVPAVTLADLLRTRVSPLKGDGSVRGTFTRRGYDEQVHPRMEKGLLGAEVWVLGPLENLRTQDGKGSNEGSLAAIRSEYYRQYIENWKKFLETLHVAQPANTAYALEQLDELTRGKPPPFGRLFQGLAYQVSLGSGGGLLHQAGQSLVDKVKGVWNDKAPSAVKNALASDDDNLLDEGSVPASFGGLLRFGIPPPKDDSGAPPQPTPLDTYQEQLEFLRDALRADLDNPDDHGPLMSALKLAHVKMRALIDSQDVGPWRPRLQALLMPPLESVSNNSTRDAAASVSAKWCSSVFASFNNKLAKHYPFAKTGQDAAIADVGDFFRPETGAVDAFFNTELKKDVQRAGDHYQASSHLGGAYTPQLMLFLKRAREVTAALFPPGAADPTTEFSIHIRPSPRVAQVTLSVDGQRITYQNGPEEWHTLKWPGGGKVLGASLRVKSNKGVTEALEQEGEWGLFRLMETGVLQATPGQRPFAVTWKIKSLDAEVTVDFRPSRSETPFLGAPERASHKQKPMLLEPFRETNGTPPPGIVKNGSCG